MNFNNCDFNQTKIIRWGFSYQFLQYGNIDMKIPFQLSQLLDIYHYLKLFCKSLLLHNIICCKSVVVNIFQSEAYAHASIIFPFTGKYCRKDKCLLHENHHFFITERSSLDSDTDKGFQHFKKKTLVYIQSVCFITIIIIAKMNHVEQLKSFPGYHC